MIAVLWQSVLQTRHTQAGPQTYGLRVVCQPLQRGRRPIVTLHEGVAELDALPPVRKRTLEVPRALQQIGRAPLALRSR